MNYIKKLFILIIGCVIFSRCSTGDEYHFIIESKIVGIWQQSHIYYDNFLGMTFENQITYKIMPDNRFVAYDIDISKNGVEDVVYKWEGEWFYNYENNTIKFRYLNEYGELMIEYGSLSNDFKAFRLSYFDYGDLIVEDELFYRIHLIRK